MTESTNFDMFEEVVHNFKKLDQKILDGFYWKSLGSSGLPSTYCFAGLARLQLLFFRVFARTARSRKYYRRSESETQRNAAQRQPTSAGRGGGQLRYYCSLVQILPSVLLPFRKQVDCVLNPLDSKKVNFQVICSFTNVLGFSQLLKVSEKS